MTFQISKFNSLSNLQDFFNFCKTASLETAQLAAVNMWADDWEIQSHTLPYTIFIANRFLEPKGEFFLLKDKDVIIGCSGIYISEFSKDVAIAGCRTWIIPTYRNQSLSREYFLPVQKQWAIEYGCKAIALTFNDYNKNIINIWKRNRFGETRTQRQPHHIFYNNFNELPYPINIQYTKQWLIYEQLHNDFDFNWQSIALD
jgi:hypothetical protein